MASDRSQSDRQHSDVAADRELPLSKDDLFHVLQNARRRAVLRYLLEHDDREQFTLRELAEAVAAWEHDTTARALEPEEYQRVYIALYQTHFPKLDEHDVVEYEKGRGTIEPTPLIYMVAPYLGDGLHDATDRLSVGDADEDDSNHRLVDIVSGLFRG